MYAIKVHAPAQRKNFWLWLALDQL